jgi:rod shape-determining protein MreB and related proteins
VVLDAGHGGDNLGTESAGGLLEKTVTLDLAERARRLLVEQGFEVIMVRQSKEQHSFLGEASAPVVVSAPVGRVPTEIDITSEMRAACELIVPPIIETLMALLSQVDPEFQSRVRNNVTLAGGERSSAISARRWKPRSIASAAAR